MTSSLTQASNNSCADTTLGWGPEPILCNGAPSCNDYMPLHFGESAMPEGAGNTFTLEDRGSGTFAFVARRNGIKYCLRPMGCLSKSQLYPCVDKELANWFGDTSLWRVIEEENGARLPKNLDGAQLYKLTNNDCPAQSLQMWAPGNNAEQCEFAFPPGEFGDSPAGDACEGGTNRYEDPTCTLVAGSTPLDLWKLEGITTDTKLFTSGSSGGRHNVATMTAAAVVGLGAAALRSSCCK